MSDNPYKPKLVFFGEHFAGRVYELTQEKTTVGRGDRNTLTVHDSSVSQAHCEILVNGPEVIVIDLGSANGTYVNGARLRHQQAQLKSGQPIRFGSVEARLELASVPDDHTVSDITAVVAHRRSLHDQQRQQNTPKAGNPSMTLDDGSDSGGTERTVTFKTTPPSAECVAAPVPEPSTGRPGKNARKLLMVIAAVLAAVIVLLWLWGGRK